MLTNNTGCGRGRGRGGGVKDNNNIDNNWTPIHDIALDTPTLSTPFTQQPGLRTTLTANSSSLDFFSLFFDEAIFQMLIDGMNKFAEKTIAEKERAWKLIPGS